LPIVAIIYTTYYFSSTKFDNAVRQPRELDMAEGDAITNHLYSQLPDAYQLSYTDLTHSSRTRRLHHHASVFDVVISQPKSVDAFEAHPIWYKQPEDLHWNSAAHTKEKTSVEEALTALLGIMRRKLVAQTSRSLG
jgi:hypothetical protein